MESFFEKRFKFNPANVDRFTYTDVDAIVYYTHRRSRTQLVLFGMTLISVILAVVILGIAIVVRLIPIVFLLSLIVLLIGGVSYRVLRSYFFHNFSLKTIHNFQNKSFVPNPVSILIERSIMAQGIAMGSLLVSLSIALIVPPPPPPPLPPTATRTPSMTFTPSQTFTPSVTFTPSITPTPSFTPTFVYYVNSPRAVAVRICPEVNCEVLAMLDPTSEIVVVNDDGAWVEIRLADGRIGFIATFLTSSDVP